MQLRRVFRVHGFWLGFKLLVRKLLFNQPISSLPQDQLVDLGDHFSNYWGCLSRKGAFYAQAPMRGARVLIVADLNIPQCKKYRVDGLVELLERNGVPTEVSYYQDVSRVMQFIGTCSHVIFYRVPMCTEFMDVQYECNRAGIHTIYDIDDPIFSVDAYLNYGNADYFQPDELSGFVKQARSYWAAMRCCDTLSVSTSKLKHLAARYYHKPIVVRKNLLQAVDFALDVPSLVKTRGRKFTVAFATGSRGREDDIQVALDGLVRFVKAHEDVVFQVIGEFDLQVLPAEVRAVTSSSPKLSYRDYLLTLARADVAILPLADSAFNQSKSAVRYLDSCLARTPVIASDVGDYGECISHAETGFLVRDNDDWYEYLSLIYAQPGDARVMTEAAFEWQKQLSATDNSGITGHYGGDLVRLLQQQCSGVPNA